MSTGTTRSQSALRSWKARRINEAWRKAHIAEAASKDALKLFLEARGWRVAFFEGATGAPRTGIIDAIAYRLGRKQPDRLDLRLIQLKGGKAGVTAREIARLKKAAADLEAGWLIAAYDAEEKALQFLPDEPAAKF
jgi:hypothetical protein